MAATIRGYLVRFDDRAEIGPDRYERFVPGSIINKTVALRLAHNPSAGANFAHARIHQDQFECAFEAVIPKSCNGLGYARMICGGCDSVSMAFRALAERREADVTVIERARLPKSQSSHPASTLWQSVG
jgi:hypothetical protein